MTKVIVMSEKRIFPEITDPEEIKQTLEAACYAFEEDMVYSRPITPGEEQIYKDTLMHLSIKKAEEEEFFATQKDAHKNRLKPLEMQYNESRTALRTKQVQTQGNLFLIPDLAGGVMNYYDVFGLLVHNRELFPAEIEKLKQMPLFRSA